MQTIDTIGSLSIEITRKCNLTCKHCLRGDSQHIDIANKYITEIMTKVNNIKYLTITGGEPSLVPDKLQYIFQTAKEQKVSIGYFYIATNAVKINKEFIFAILELYSYCKKKYLCCVDISKDIYHLFAISSLNKRGKWEENKTLLKALYICEDRDDTDSIIQEGRGINISSNRVYHLHEINIDKKENVGIYLNCKGVFVSDSGLSYNTQDIPFFQIGKVMDDIDLKRECNKYNTRLKSMSSHVLYNVLDEIKL